MFSKKGMEMSVTILVGIILGIAMLAASMLLFFNIMAKTDGTEKQLDAQTREKIIQALDTGEPVFVPLTNVDAEKGYAYFWVGMKNINAEPQTFKLNVTLLNPSDVPEAFDKEHGIAFVPGPYTIPAKESEMPSVAVKMKGVTKRVALLVNVSVQDGSNWVQYQKPKIVYIEP